MKKDNEVKNILLFILVLTIMFWAIAIGLYMFRDSMLKQSNLCDCISDGKTIYEACEEEDIKIKR